MSKYVKIFLRNCRRLFELIFCQTNKSESKKKSSPLTNWNPYEKRKHETKLVKNFS